MQRKKKKRVKKRSIKIKLDEGSEVKGNMEDMLKVKDHRFVLADREEAGS